MTTTTTEPTYPKHRPFRPRLSAQHGNGNGTQPPATTLPFDRPFQTQVLRLCLDDPAWLPHLKYNYFDNPLEGQVFKVLQSMPQPVSLVTLARACIRKLGRPATRRVIGPLENAQLTKADRAQMIPELEKFIKFQRLGESFINASEAYQAQDLARLEQVWDRAHQPLPGAEERFALTTLSEVIPRSVPWAWRDHLVHGALTILAGDPGVGKSMLAIDLGARITRGDRWPDGSGGRRPGRDIIVLATEDALEYIIRPRFEAAGADLTKVHALAFQTTSTGLSLVDDAQALEARIIEKRAAYVIIDPLSDYLPKVNTWRDNEVRVALKPFAAIAQRHKVVAVGNMHLSKGDADRAALYRILGSVAFAGLARTIFLVTEDPEDQTRRLFLPIKNNFGLKADGMAFRPTAAWIPGQPHRIKSQRLVWLTKEPVTLTANEALRPQVGSTRASVRAETLLKQDTAEGPARATAIYQHAEAEHISERTIRAVRKRLGMRARKVGTLWYLSPAGWTKDQLAAWTPKPTSDEERAG